MPFSPRISFERVVLRTTRRESGGRPGAKSSASWYATLLMSTVRSPSFTLYEMVEADRD